jgi:hypothetical protein
MYTYLLAWNSPDNIITGAFAIGSIILIFVLVRYKNRDTSSKD